MKAFDLERAKAGDPVMTRDGKDLPEIGNIPEINYKDYKQIMLNDLIKDINGGVNK